MKSRSLVTVFAALLIFAAGYAALFIAPDEKTMHAIQRIFYFHLPSWIAMFGAFCVVFYANLAYLITRKPKWDALGVSARRSRSGVLYRRPDHRSAMGAPGLGNLVDMGRRLTIHFRSVASVHRVSAFARPDRGPGEEGRAFSNLRNLRFSRYSARLPRESPLAHPASPARHLRGDKARASIPPWAKFCCFALSPSLA